MIHLRGDNFSYLKRIMAVIEQKQNKENITKPKMLTSVKTLSSFTDSDHHVSTTNHASTILLMRTLNEIVNDQLVKWITEKINNEQCMDKIMLILNGTSNGNTGIDDYML